MTAKQQPLALRRLGNETLHLLYLTVFSLGAIAPVTMISNPAFAQNSQATTGETSFDVAYAIAHSGHSEIEDLLNDLQENHRNLAEKMENGDFDTIEADIAYTNKRLDYTYNKVESIISNTQEYVDRIFEGLSENRSFLETFGYGLYYKKTRSNLYEAYDNLAQIQSIIVMTHKRREAAKAVGNSAEYARMDALLDQQVKAYKGAWVDFVYGGYTYDMDWLRGGVDKVSDIKNEVTNNFYEVLMSSDDVARQFLEDMPGDGTTEDAQDYIVRSMYAYGSKGGDTDATDLYDRFLSKEILANNAIRTYRITTDGEFGRDGEMTLFVNYGSGEVVGYGTAGFTETLDVNSLMNYGEGVYVGQLNADKTQINGRFLGISGGNSLANDYQINSGGRVPDDVTGMSFTILPQSAFTNGGSGTITVDIYVGDPLATGNNATKTLTYNVQETEYEPYKLGTGYNITVDESKGPVTYQGYGRISKQNRKTAAALASDVMDDLGDLTVTVDNTAGAESMDFSFNASDPQATSTDAVVNHRTAGAISQLADNMLRSGVMFPLEGYDSTNIVHFVDFSDGLYNGTSNDIGYGFGIVGTPTPAPDMPSGTATYNGGVAGYTSNEVPTGTISSSEQFYGTTTLNVNFDTTAVTGSMALLNHNDGSSLNDFTISGNVAGNGLNLTTITDGNTATGSGIGTFYGSAAQEVGGQFGVTDAPNDTKYEGVFWGKK